jgi:hypothetical protein
MGGLLMTNHTLQQLAAQRFSAKQIEKGFKPESLHTYTDMLGNVVYWRIRLKHPDGNKWIRPMYQDVDGQFHLGEPPEIKTKPLYGLQYLIQHPDALIFIVEGEYPADALNQFFEKQHVINNYIAITSGSATSADTADWKPLAGKSCVIWPDHDEPGENYANQVTTKLKSFGNSIDRIELANLNLPIGGDCVDWLAKNPSAILNDLLGLRCPITSEESLPTNDNATIAKLIALSPVEYDRKRISIAKTMGIRPATLDSMVKAEKALSQDANTPFSEIEPWHEPVNPAILLTNISNTIKSFIVCQNETVTAATLWAAMTWFIDVIQVAPLAVITAPEKRCGKSQMLFLLSRIVNRPLAASNITSSALFRSIDAWQPTLLIRYFYTRK